MTRFNLFYVGELKDILDGDNPPPTEAERAVLIINLARRVERLEREAAQNRAEAQR